MKTLTLKIPIMGEAGVGKTSLANVLSGSHFPDEYRSTIGVDIFIRMLTKGENVIRVQLWDLAGQKRFSFLRKVFYRGAHAAIFMFDLTRRQTFEELPGWIEDFLSAYPNTPFILIGNKTDLSDKREVSREEAEALAKKFGGLYIETSVKKGVNVQKAFDVLISMIPRRLGVISL